MKNKIILTFLLGIMLLSLCSALEFDNSKVYNSINKEITISNTFGLGSDIGKIKLINYNRYCLPSECYAYYELDNYEQDTLALKSTAYYDEKQIIEDKNKISKYEIWSDSASYEVPTYTQECSNAVNKTTGKDERVCNYVQSGTDLKYGKYIPYNPLETLKIGKYTLKEKIDIRAGETIDIVPNFYGKDITEWVVFTGMIRNEYYNELNTANGDTIAPTSASYQVFTIGTVGANESLTVSGVSARVYSDGPPGTLARYSATIYNMSVEKNLTACDFTKPLADGADDYNIDQTQGWLANITMDNTRILYPGKSYCLKINSNLTPAQGGAQWKVDRNGTYAGGSLHSQDSGTWQSGYDFLFEIYGTTSSYTLNSVTFNSSSYQMLTESFILNITNNTYPISSVNFIYNGTTYAASNSGQNWITSVTHSTTDYGNKSFYWNITNGTAGNSYSTDNYYQFVNPTILGLCNSTLSIPYINFTFKDEATLLNINASLPTSTFQYYIRDGNLTKSFSYVSTVENSSYRLCASPSDRTFNIDSYVQYQATGYPQRIYNPSILSFTNSTNNITLYLLGVADGSYVTFQVTNANSQVISGVEVTANRSISGGDVTVGAGSTGDDGTVTFWLNPNFIHTYTFSKTGFTTFVTSFAPTQTSYTITMGGGTTSQNDSFKGISYTIGPNNNYLLNDTTYTFNYTLLSSFSDVTDYGFNLRLSNGTIISGSNTGIEGTTLSKNYDVNDQSIIYMDYYWVVNGDRINATRYWNVQNTDNTQWSIAVFVTDLTLYINSGLFGIDEFGRYLLIFIIIFTICGVTSYKYGLSSPLAVMTIAFGTIFFFDVVVNLIPEIRGIDNLLTYITAIILILLIFKEVRQ